MLAPPKALVALRTVPPQEALPAESAARGLTDDDATMSMRLAMKASLESAQMDEKEKQKALLNQKLIYL